MWSAEIKTHLLHTPSLNMRQAYDLHGLIPTSTAADTFLIRSHIAYWCGHAEAESAEIETSRGHSYKVKIWGSWHKPIQILDHYDHRNGVAGLGCNEHEQQRRAQLMFS